MKGKRKDRIRNGGDRPVTPFSFPGGPPARPLSAVAAFLLAVLSAGTAIAASSTITVSAVVLSKSICKFRTNAAALDFGTLDTGNPVDVTRVTSLEFRCMGSVPVGTYAVTDDDGLHETGPDVNRMQHLSTATEYIPYRMTVNPDSGTVPKGEYRTLTISGTVRGTDYRNALPGSYADTVVITIDP